MREGLTGPDTSAVQECDFTVDRRRLHARLDGPPTASPSYPLETGLGVSSPLVLIGHSSGALWVRLCAAQHPQRVSALVLLDPKPLTLPRWLTATFGLSAMLTRGLVSLADLGVFAVEQQVADEA